MKFTSCFISGIIALVMGSLTGYWLADTLWQLKESRRIESEARQETEVLRKAQERNRNLQATVENLQTRMMKENKDAQKKIDDLLGRINRGDVRVSIAARSCNGMSSGSGSSFDAGKARAELDPAVVERILAVGRDGDSAVRSLNQCIDQYRALAGFSRP